MAYFESITAGRGGLEGFNQALNNQRYANLLLNESMGNFANTIANAGSLFDNAKIREEALKYQRMRDLANDKKQAEALKYQRMRDLANDKKQAEAFDLQKRQVEQSMDFAKKQQIMSEEMHKQNKKLNDHRAKAMQQENRLNEHQFKWIMEANPSAKASVSVDNNAKKTAPTTPSANHTQGVLNTQNAPKPKTIIKEEFKAIYANPVFRF